MNRQRYLNPVPQRDDDGVPRCTERCPYHDGKRCAILGHRPDSLCEPAVREMALKLTTVVPAWLNGLREGSSK